jgi:hypothetical protein
MQEPVLPFMLKVLQNTIASYQFIFSIGRFPCSSVTAAPVLKELGLLPVLWIISQKSSKKN